MRFEFPFFGKKRGAAEASLSDEGALLTQPYSGEWYHAAKQGNVFIGNSAAAGVVPPIYTSTSQVFGLWNPAGSNVNGVIIKVAGTYVDTTGAAGGYCLAVNKNIGSATATGSLSAFTAGVPERGVVGQTMGEAGNRIRFTPSAATTVAPTILCQLGVSQLVLTATDATNGLFHFYREFKGDLVIGPGTAIWVCGNIATTSKWALSITWAEELV